MRYWFVHLQMGETGKELGIQFHQWFRLCSNNPTWRSRWCLSKVERLKCQKQQWQVFLLKAFQVLLWVTLPIHFEITVAGFSGQSNIVATHYSICHQGRTHLLPDKANVPKVQIYQGTLTRWAFLQLPKTIILYYSQQSSSWGDRETHEVILQHHTLFL